MALGLMWGCRAASPLAAVEVYGSGKCPGGMNPSPTESLLREIVERPALRPPQRGKTDSL